MATQNNKIEITPEVSGTPVTSYPANANFTTDAIRIDGNYDSWAFQTTADSLDGSPVMDMEVSLVNIPSSSDWTIYKTVQDCSIPNYFYDSSCPFENVRFVFRANGNTTGTISFNLTLKK